ncbi:MAG: hypothetical protein K9M49_01675 [Candidatus Marinimicrobia bacterium]|nr:hypothetical protein [Candidatus Neomarinimicrobiota bacterium]MCF7850265.1 hypothetical protein [Candidatus Neomarinimicrobiota bacterium]MCF7903838.1 hypothetical protein [Candidatus Neomarinimicrobiota bacterium]
MTKQLLKTILLSGFLVQVGMAETPSYQILNYPFSSRSAAMGGGRAIDPTGGMDIQGNPAGMTFADKLSIQTGYVNHLVGIKGYSAGGLLPLQRHRLSLETTFFDYGQFDATSLTGVTTGAFGYQEMSVALGYAFKFSETMSLGTRIGHYTRTVDLESNSDFYYDVGAVYNQEADSLSVGVYLAATPLGDSQEPMPRQLRVGSSKVLSHLPLRLNLEGIYAFDEQLRLALGAEVLLHPSFRLRLGVNSNRFDFQTGVNESDFVAGASAGFVIDWHGILIESATQSFGGIGWVSQMSLSYQL